MIDILTTDSAGMIIFCVGLFLIVMHNVFFEKPAIKRRTVIDKYITWDQHGNPHYWIIVKNTEGNLEQLSVSHRKYYSYKTDSYEE